MTPHRDKEHGRIYRVYPKGSKDIEKPDSLTDAISSPDLFWRTTAQRLIVDSSDKSQAPALKALVEKGETPAAISAFGTLQGLGLLDLKTISSALKSTSPALRRMALPFAPLDNTLVDIFIRDGKITEADPRTRMELYLALARLAPSEEIATALAADPRMAQTKRFSMHGKSQHAGTSPQSSRNFPETQARKKSPTPQSPPEC